MRLVASLFRLSFRRDPDFADLRPLQRVHQRHQLLHRQFTIRSNDDRHFRVRLLQFFELTEQLVDLDRLVVELDDRLAIDRNGLDLRRIDRRVRRAARRDNKIHAVLEERCRDHENDEQHERKIEQGRDVDLRQRRERVTL